MLLGHGVFRPVDAVQDELSEEGIAHLPGHLKMLLPILIDQKNMICRAVPGSHVDVFSQLDVTLRPQDEGPPVPPGGKAVRREPVHPEMLGRPVVPHEDGVPEILQLRIVRMPVIAHLAVLHLRVLHAAVIQELLDLMAADVTEDPAVFVLFKKPVRAALRIAHPVRAEAVDVDGPSDGSLFDQLPGEDGGLHMDALAVIDHIFSSGLLYHLLCRLKLLQAGEGSLVRKIVLPRRHHPKPKRAAQAGHRGSAYQLHLRVGKDLLLACRGLRRGKALLKSRNLRRIRVIDPLHLGPRLRQAVAHPVDMPVIQRDGSDLKFPGSHHRRRLSLGRIVHSVFFLHICLVFRCPQGSIFIRWNWPQGQFQGRKLWLSAASLPERLCSDRMPKHVRRIFCPASPPLL